MKHIALLALFAMLLSGCGAPVFQTNEIDKQHLLLLNNKERGSKNLEQLLEDSELDQLAQKHSEWMAKYSFTHSRLNLSKYNYMGENIAKGQETEESVIEGWMQSHGHRQNILNSNYTHAGIGYVKADGKSYWCVIFGG